MKKNENTGYYRDFMKHAIIQAHKYLKSLEKEKLHVLEYKIDIEIHWFDKDNTKRTGFFKIKQDN